MFSPLDLLPRLLRSPKLTPRPTCVVCAAAIFVDEPYMAVRGSMVHHQCATYRMRYVDSATGPSRHEGPRGRR